MAKVEGIEINAQTIKNCYRRYYPASYKQIEDNLFHYLHLFGIRVSTCDTSVPDDLVGGLRINNLNFLESVVSEASTEPSPKNIGKLADAKIIMQGGAAFIIPGQYTYSYIGTKHPKWKPHPSFCPLRPVKVYRWMPSSAEIKAWNNGNGTPISTLFDKAVREKKVKISTSPDVCIHRSFSKQKLWADSAGCQILTNYEALGTLGKWANEHISKKYGNSFLYTLFTKEQFVAANTGGSQMIVTPTRTNTKPNTDTSSGFWQKLLSGLLRK